MKWRELQNIIFIIFLLLILASILLYYFLADEFSLTEFRSGLAGFGVLAPLVFIIIYTLGTIFIPSTPFMALAGILFGFKYGLIYTIIGGLLSSVITFNISRKLGQEKVENILGHKYLKRLEKYNKKLETGAFWDLVILRALPIMPFNILNIIMGVSRIQISDYILGTIIGLIPSNILAVYFGNLMTKIF